MFPEENYLREKKGNIWEELWDLEINCGGIQKVSIHNSKRLTMEVFHSHDGIGSLIILRPTEMMQGFKTHLSNK